MMSGADVIMENNTWIEILNQGWGIGYKMSQLRM